MSIYENGPRPKNKNRTKEPPRKADTKKIRNDKTLTNLVNQISGGPTTAKEILYDTDKNIVGILQRNDDPFFLNPAQTKELERLLKG